MSQESDSPNSLSLLRPETLKGSKPFGWTEDAQREFWRDVHESTQKKNAPYDRARALSLAGANIRFYR